MANMMTDPYKYLWREEINADYPCHIYITRGTTLYGFIQRNTTEIVWFKTPKQSWSPTRRKFRKFNKKDIDFYIEQNELTMAA